MKKKILSLVLVGGLLISAMLTGCGSDTEKTGETTESEVGKVGCILGVGGLGDQSFNDLVFAGLEKAEAELGVEFDYAEPTQVTDFEVMLRDMANTMEYDVIISVGFDATDGLTKVAPEFPEQNFAIIDNVIDLPNVVSYGAKEEEGAFLAGTVAGLMKKDAAAYGVEDNNQIGFLAAIDTPLLNKWNAGYQAGAKYVNPNVVCEVGYVAGDNPFGDTTTAKEIAISQYNRGADIMFHAAGGSGLGVFDAAAEYDFVALGCNSNQNTINPDHIVASVLKQVDTAAYNIAKAACVDKNLAVGSAVTLGLADTGMNITFERSNLALSEADLAIVNEVKDKIVAGEIVVPAAVEEVDAFAKENTYK